MKQPTFVELWELYQKRIREKNTAAEILLEIWELGYSAAIEDTKKNKE